VRLRDLISRFDGFVIDQYGVLHDGVRPYPGAIAALEAINAAGKRAVLVTNSGKSAVANEERLARLGFARALYAALVSSGEAARVGIADGVFGPAFVPGARVHVVGRTGDDYGLDRFPLQRVDLSAATPRASRSTIMPSD
jgi:HAD superfamily hydrolase (TIGR01459 family)